MKQTNVPVVGVSATLPELSNKTRYPAFVRTIPSDLKQAQVIIEIAKEFQWSYVIGIHTNDNYGIQGMAEVKRLALENGICVSKVEEFKLDTTPTSQQMESFVRVTLFNIIDRANGSIGIIYFGNDRPILDLLTFIRDNRSRWPNAINYLKKIHWIATDGVMPTQELGALVDEYGTKMLLLGPLQIELNSFEEYFKNLLQEPPAWLNGQWLLALKYVVENTYKCVGYNFTKDPSCNIIKGNPNGYMAAALDAVYLLANTLKTIFKATCDKKPETCSYFKEILHTGLLKTNNLTDLDYGSLEAYNIPPEFSKLPRSLKKVSGDFEAVNQTLYSIKANRNSSIFVEIGSYKTQKVNIYESSTPIVEPSQCRGKCEECAHIGDIDYIYSHGKYIMIGLFSIHQNSDNNPFGCGEYRAQSLSYIASKAFLTAIAYLKNVTELDFGYLLIDDCNNPLMSSQKIIKMLSGEMLVVDKTTGAKFQPSSVVVVIGAQSSIVTMSLLPNLQNFGIPMISYGATNTALDNGINYPYFLRTVSPDTIQAKAIVAILIELNVSRVGVIVIDNMYGLGLNDLFRNFAEAENICVDNAVRINENTDNKILLQTLKRYKIEEIKVVVTIVTDQTVGIILDAVNSDDVFVFIASEGWGPNPLVMETRRKKARGALILGSYSPDLPDYGLKNVLKSMDPYSESNNGWLKDLWQQQFQCNLPGGFNNIYTTQCHKLTDGSYLSDSVLTNLVKQPLPVHTTIATLSAGLALKSLIDSQPISSQSWTLDPATFINTTRSFQLTPGTGSLQNLSKAGFQIYNIQHTDGYDYTFVGTYSGNGTLRIQKQLVKFYNELGQTVDNVISSCQGRTGCSVCGPISLTSPMTQPSTENYTGGDSVSSDGLITALAVIIAILCLVIITVVVFIVLRARGLMPCKCEKSYDAPKTIAANPSGSSNLTPSYPNSTDGLNEQQTSIESGNQGRPGLPPRKSETTKIFRNINSGDVMSSNLSDISNNSVRSRAKTTTQQGAHSSHKVYNTANISMAEFPPPKAHSPLQKDYPNYSSSSGSAVSQALAEVVETQSRKPTQDVRPLHSSLASDNSGSGVSGSSNEIVYTTVRPMTLGEEVKPTPSSTVGLIKPQQATQPEYLHLLNNVQPTVFSPPSFEMNGGQSNYGYIQTLNGIFLVSIHPNNQDYKFRDNTKLPFYDMSSNANFVYDNEGYITPLESPYHFFQHPITFLPSGDYGRKQDFITSERTSNTTPCESNDSAPTQMLHSQGHQGIFVPQQLSGGLAVNQTGPFQGKFVSQQYAGSGPVNQNSQLQGMFLPQQQFMLQFVNPEQKNIPQQQTPQSIAAHQQNVPAMTHQQASGMQIHQRPNSLAIASNKSLIHREVAPVAANSQTASKNVYQMESPAVHNNPQGKLSSSPNFNVISKDTNGNEQNIQGSNKGSLTTAQAGKVKTLPSSGKGKESTDNPHSRFDRPEGSPVTNLPVISAPVTTIHPGSSRHLHVVEEVDDTNISIK